ncbi:MAG: hypothetical protein P4K97_07740 [Terracidiphilus sp.]|nr:hypothetical protein [Terracidiphilus sp.]
MIERAQVFGAIIDANHRPGIAARGQQYIQQKARHTSIAVRRGMDVAKEPVVVPGYYKFFLPCGYKSILLRHGECKAMQAGAYSLWKKAKIRMVRQNLVPVLVPVGVGILSILMHRSALSSPLASVDIKAIMRRNASPCEALQNPKNKTHNPLVRGSNPCRPTKSL